MEVEKREMFSLKQSRIQSTVDQRPDTSTLTAKFLAAFRAVE